MITVATAVFRDAAPCNLVQVRETWVNLDKTTRHNIPAGSHTRKEFIRIFVTKSTLHEDRCSILLGAKPFPVSAWRLLSATQHGPVINRLTTHLYLLPKSGDRGSLPPLRHTSLLHGAYVQELKSEYYIYML
jgi:hypothetical protein